MASSIRPGKKLREIVRPSKQKNANVGGSRVTSEANKVLDRLAFEQNLRSLASAPSNDIIMQVKRKVLETTEVESGPALSRSSELPASRATRKDRSLVLPSPLPEIVSSRESAIERAEGKRRKSKNSKHSTPARSPEPAVLHLPSVGAPLFAVERTAPVPTPPSAEEPSSHHALPPRAPQEAAQNAASALPSIFDRAHPPDRSSAGSRDSQRREVDASHLPEVSRSTRSSARPTPRMTPKSATSSKGAFEEYDPLLPPEDDYFNSDEYRDARARAEQQGRAVGDGLRRRANEVDDAINAKIEMRMLQIENASKKHIRYQGHKQRAA